MEKVAPAASERLPKAWRLLKRADFLRAQRHATSVRGPFFVLVLHLRDDDLAPRLGVIASRKAGNAVQRNRSKRLIREWFRRRRTGVPNGNDLVVIVRRGADGRSYGEVCSELDGSLRRALSKTAGRRRRAGGARADG